MACTPDDIRALDVSGTDFPDPPYTDAVLQAFLDCAGTLIDDQCSAPLVDKAVCYLAAHLALKFKDGGGGGAAAGNVLSESAGGLSRSFGPISLMGSDSFFTSTAYGQFYVVLRDALPCGVVPLVLSC